MDWDKCILYQPYNKNLLDPSKTLNLRVCGYTLLANNTKKFIEEEIAQLKKITIDLNYLRSEGKIAKLSERKLCRIA